MTSIRALVANNLKSQINPSPPHQTVAPPPVQPLHTISRSQLLKSSLLLGTATAISLAPILSAVAAATTATTTTAAPLLSSTTASISTAQQSISGIVLNTLSDCQLAVSVYPTFGYNAAGGGGTGTVTKDTSTPGLLHVEFDADSLNIPPISYATSTVLGIPIPPPLKIAIKPKKLQGTIDTTTGRVELDFLAGFEFTAGPLYTAPPLVVETVLTTEESRGVLRSGRGERMSADGRARLVGVARVPVTGDGLLDTFLMLPTDALAVLSAELKFE